MLPEPELLLAVEPPVELPVEPEEPPLEADGLELLLPLEGWSLDELLELPDGELELGVLDDEEPLLSLLFIARLPVDEPEEPDGLVLEFGEDEAMPEEPEEPDEPDCESRESLPRSQAESAKVAASAAAAAVRKNRFCTMSTIS